MFRYVTHTHRERAENRPRLARDLSVCGLCGWGNYAPFMLRLLLLLSSTALMFRSAGALCMGVQGHALRSRSSVPRLAARSRLLGTKQVRMVAKPDDTAVQPYDDGLFAVAPMMDTTDRFLRFLLRRLTTKATLYTEMVTANTIVHCQESELPRFLEHDTVDEQPVVLQIGGADPENLRKASAIAEPYGYSAINLNVGCPSDRVAGSGCFGAALMENPILVADCCAAMADGVGHRLPITVKCRIGVTKDRRRAKEIDDEATYDELAFCRHRRHARRRPMLPDPCASVAGRPLAGAEPADPAAAVSRAPSWRPTSPRCASHSTAALRRSTTPTAPSKTASGGCRA